MRKYTVALSACLLMARSLIAHDPFKDQIPRQQTEQDPDKFSRPTTNTLKGAEIKEFRDKLNAARAQVFKEEIAPGGARFRAQTEDVAGNRFQAEAPIGHFNEAVQLQIISKLPDAKDATRSVLVDITIDGQTVRVDSAQLTDSKTPPVKKQIQSQTLTNPNSISPSKTNVPAVTVPRIETPKPSAITNSLRNPEQTKEASPAVIPAKAGIQVSNNSLKKVYSLDSRFRGNDDTVKIEPTSTHPEITKVAQSIIGEPTALVHVPPSRVPVNAAHAPVVLVAVIPIVGASALTVTSAKGSKADSTVTVEVHATAQTLPEAIKNQIKNDVPDASPALTEKGEVTVVMTIKPDHTFAVVSVKTIPNPGETTQAVIPAQAGIQAVNFPRKNVQGLDFRLRGNDDKAVDEPGLMEVAKTLAPLVGADPKTVRMENRPAHVFPAGPVQTVVLTLQNGGEILVRELSNNPKSDKPGYEAELKFGDLSMEMKGQILAMLSDFGAEALLKDDTKVQVDFAIQPDGKPTSAPQTSRATVGKQVVTQIAIVNKDASSNQQVVLIKQSELVSAKGLAPAVASLIQTGFGVEKGKFEIKDVSGNGNIRVEVPPSRTPEKRNILLTWASETVSGQYDFTAQGKPLDFSDAIREAIYAKLREAVENGESWSTEALTGKKEIVVEFVVAQEGNEKGEKIKIKSVSSTMRDAGSELARNMGLAEGDYLLVNTGAQMLVAIEKGKVGTLKVGDKFVQLKSIDGGANVFVKQNQSKKESDILLMLSRESLEENRDALVRFTGKDAAELISQALEQNSSAGQFLVRVNPQAEEKLFIKPIVAPAKEDVKK